MRIEVWSVGGSQVIFFVWRKTNDKAFFKVTGKFFDYVNVNMMIIYIYKNME